jgi:hypothetical protein
MEIMFTYLENIFPPFLRYITFKWSLPQPVSRFFYGFPKLLQANASVILKISCDLFFFLQFTLYSYSFYSILNNIFGRCSVVKRYKNQPPTALPSELGPPSPWWGSVYCALC